MTNQCKKICIFLNSFSWLMYSVLRAEMQPFFFFFEREAFARCVGCGD
jgi:hypothetical protein